MCIRDRDSTELYAGNGTEAEDFTVNIPADGVYIISVDGRQAAGTLHIPVSYTHLGSEAFRIALFRTAQPFCRRKRRYSSLVHLLWRGKPASFMKMCIRDRSYTDPENEAVIQSALGRLVRGKTLLVIAHRLSIIRCV